MIEEKAWNIMRMTYMKKEKEILYVSIQLNKEKPYILNFWNDDSKDFVDEIQYGDSNSKIAFKYIRLFNTDIPDDELMIYEHIQNIKSRELLINLYEDDIAEVTE